MTDTPFIVSTTWVRENLENSQVVIVDCRFSLNDPELGREQYKISHIPGAYYLHLNEDLSSRVGKHGGRHPLPDVDKLAKKLGEIGINSPETLVVAYDDSRLAFASRLWWLLRYLGHDRVALMDGGFSAWQKADYTITDGIPALKTGKFTPQERIDWVVDIDTVKTRKDLPEVALIDSREAPRYRGEYEPIDPVAGHIPGAVNYPWQDVTNAEGKVLSVAEQQQRWQDLASTGEIIVYCGSGVTACVNLLSLEIAGIKGAKLYAGSWSDWCSYMV